MTFTFGPYTIDVDIDATRSFYKNREESLSYCGCVDCARYRAYTAKCPAELRDFFTALGLDIAKPGEVFTCSDKSENPILYGGWYHLCGRVLQTDRHQEITENGLTAIVSGEYVVTEDFRVSFHDECTCVPKDFPNPCIQMEITAFIPKEQAE